MIAKRIHENLNTKKRIQPRPGKVDPIDVCVGATTRQLRMARKISQQRLGKHLGVSFQQVQKYEKGDNRMSSSTLYKIAEFLGVEIGDLFTGVALSLEHQKATEKGSDKMKCGQTRVFSMPLLDGEAAGLTDSELIGVLTGFQRIGDNHVRAAVKQLINRLSAPADPF